MSRRSLQAIALPVEPCSGTSYIGNPKHPKLRDDLVIQRVTHGSHLFVDVSDPASGQTQRFNEHDYMIVSAMNGRRDAHDLSDWVHLGVAVTPLKIDLTIRKLDRLGFLAQATCHDITGQQFTREIGTDANLPPGVPESTRRACGMTQPPQLSSSIAPFPQLADLRPATEKPMLEAFSDTPEVTTLTVSFEEPTRVVEVTPQLLEQLKQSRNSDWETTNPHAVPTPSKHVLPRVQDVGDSTSLSVHKPSFALSKARKHTEPPSNGRNPKRFLFGKSSSSIMLALWILAIAGSTYLCLAIL